MGISNVSTPENRENIVMGFFCISDSSGVFKKQKKVEHMFHVPINQLN
jgi:hypothetical protein